MPGQRSSFGANIGKARAVSPGAIGTNLADAAGACGASYITPEGSGVAFMSG